MNSYELRQAMHASGKCCDFFTWSDSHSLHISMGIFNWLKTHSLPIYVPILSPSIGMYWHRNQSWDQNHGRNRAV